MAMKKRPPGGKQLSRKRDKRAIAAGGAGLLWEELMVYSLQRQYGKKTKNRLLSVIQRNQKHASGRGVWGWYATCFDIQQLKNGGNNHMHKPGNRSIATMVVAMNILAFSGVSLGGASLGVEGPVRLEYKQGSVQKTEMFSTIQAAIDAGAVMNLPTRPVVKLPPGYFNETVTMKPGMDLVGAGKDASIIACNCGGGLGDKDAAALVAADDSGVRDLSIRNLGSQGSGYSIGVFVDSVSFSMSGVDVYAGGGQDINRALDFRGGNSTNILEVDHASITAAGGQSNTGIDIDGIGAQVNISNSTIEVFTGSGDQIGISVSNNGHVNISNSTITARSGIRAAGLYVAGGNADVAYSSVIAASAATSSMAVWNDGGATIKFSTLKGDSYTIFHTASPLYGRYGYNQFLIGGSGQYTNSATYGGSGDAFNCIGNFDESMVATGC